MFFKYFLKLRSTRQSLCSFGILSINTFTCPLSVSPCPIPLTRLLHPLTLSGRWNRQSNMSMCQAQNRPGSPGRCQRSFRQKEWDVYTHPSACTLPHTHTNMYTLQSPGICDSARPTWAPSSEDGWYRLSRTPNGSAVQQEDRHSWISFMNVCRNSDIMALKKVNQSLSKLILKWDGNIETKTRNALKKIQIYTDGRTGELALGILEGKEPPIKIDKTEILCHFFVKKS